RGRAARAPPLACRQLRPAVKRSADGRRDRRGRLRRSSSKEPPMARLNWQNNRRWTLVAQRGADPADPSYRSALDNRDLPPLEPRWVKSQAQLRREFYARNPGLRAGKAASS